MKKFFALLVTVTICVSVFSFSGSASVDTLDGKLTPAEYAVSFINAVNPELELQAEETVNIYDENNLLSGYCVSLIQNGNPYGYVVIKYIQDEPVVSEYVVEKDVSNIYNELETKNSSDYQKAEKLASTDNTEKKIYSFEPNDYYIQLDSNEYCSNSGYVYNENEYLKIMDNAKTANEKSSKYTTPDIAYATTPSSCGEVISDSYAGTLKYQYYIADFANATYLGQDSVTSYLGNNRYSCGCAALANLCSYLNQRGYTNLNVFSSYLLQRLWDLSVIETYQSDGFTLGGSSTTSQISAIKQYLSECGYSASTNAYWFAWFSDYERDLYKDQPCVFDYTVAGTGHVVLVVGFVKTSDGDNYLRVLDGWNSYSRFLNYTGYSYAAKTGFTVSMN